MNESTKYFLRIPTSDLNATLQDMSSNCLIIESSKKYSAWVNVDDLTFEIVESQEQFTSVVKYVTDSSAELNILDELGIVCDFSAEDDGTHFESSFFDPGGVKIIIAEMNDLPEGLPLTNSSTEFAIPSSVNLNDSVNFWISLGFKVNANKAKDHPWVSLEDANFKLGIHQHYNWKEPGLTIASNNKLSFDLEANGLRIKKYFSKFL